jgi:hypothetical protein
MLHSSTIPVTPAPAAVSDIGRSPGSSIAGGTGCCGVSSAATLEFRECVHACRARVCGTKMRELGY